MLLTQALALLLLAAPVAQPGPVTLDNAGKQEKKSSESRQKSPQKPPPEDDITRPPTEIDEQPAEIHYTLNPDKARKELEVGSYYYRKSNYAAAVARFQEALKWNPKFADAALRLGEAHEKRGELTLAIESYRKFLELAPKHKKGDEAAKAIARLEKEIAEEK